MLTIPGTGSIAAALEKSLIQEVQVQFPLSSLQSACSDRKSIENFLTPKQSTILYSKDNEKKVLVFLWESKNAEK